ncbi:MAG: sensor histidine kinase [Ktedonobacterales bacterium]
MPKPRTKQGERDAGKIALAVAELASSAPSWNDLAHELANLLRTELDADALALFWPYPNSIEPQASPGSPVSQEPTELPGSLTLAVAPIGGDSPLLEGRIKAATSRAYSQPEILRETTLEPLAGDLPNFSGRLVAVPIGTPVPWMVCTAWWRIDEPSSGQPPLVGEGLLLQLRPSLTVATMPAHLMELSRRAEYEVSQNSPDRSSGGATSFLSMVSHELRTPLNSINGFVEIVLEGHVGPLTSRQREFLGYVQTSSHQLTTLVEDILFVSKADSGQFVLRPARVDVDRLLRQAIQSVAQAAEEAQVRIGTRVPAELATIWGDELRLQQVITNLLHNAIKFSPPGEEISITLSQHDAFVEFAVADHGHGVAPEEQDHVFERFYQSASSQQNVGYGLGLPIAKWIVEQHHGRIWLKSTLGNGATFYFTLPLEA